MNPNHEASEVPCARCGGEILLEDVLYGLADLVAYRCRRCAERESPRPMRRTPPWQEIMSTSDHQYHGSGYE